MSEPKAPPTQITKQFQLHPKVGLMLAFINMIGICLIAFVPSEFDLIRTIGLAISMVVTGIFIAEKSAIWIAVD